MPDSLYVSDGEKSIPIRFRTESDRERFKLHYRKMDELGVRYRDERNALQVMLWAYADAMEATGLCSRWPRNE